MPLARYCGIDLWKQQLIVYGLAGAVSGISGYLWVSRYGIAYSDIALGYELTVIAACVIGGVSIAGGIGTLWGPVIGTILLETTFRRCDCAVMAEPAILNTLKRDIVTAPVSLLSRKSAVNRHEIECGKPRLHGSQLISVLPLDCCKETLDLSRQHRKARLVPQ